MKHKEAFEKWNKEFNNSRDQCLKSAHFDGWEACEEFYNKRDCCNCKSRDNFKECKTCYRTKMEESDNWEQLLRRTKKCQQKK